MGNQVANNQQLQNHDNSKAIKTLDQISKSHRVEEHSMVKLDESMEFDNQHPYF